MTCDTLCFKTNHLISTMKRCQTMIHYKKFHFTELQEKLLSSEKPFRYSCHESNTSNPNLPTHFRNIDFCTILSSNQYVETQSVQWLGCTLDDLGFKSWQKQKNYLFSKTSRPPPAPNQLKLNVNKSFFSGKKSGQGTQTDHSHPFSAEFKNQWRHISTQPVSLHVT